MDLAASVQSVTEEIVLRLARSRAKRPASGICASPEAWRSTAWRTAKLLRDAAATGLDPAAAGDAGGALGAALAAYHMQLGRRGSRERATPMQGAFLGPEFSRRRSSSARALRRRAFEMLDDTALLSRATDRPRGFQSARWFQGRMEFGPRALGNRSILGDSRSPRIAEDAQPEIKYRESFRPFAPSVLRERVSDWSSSTATVPTCCSSPMWPSPPPGMSARKASFSASTNSTSPRSEFRP